MDSGKDKDRMSTLRAEDGSPLEIKEGVVLDRDGTPITPEPRHSQEDAYTFAGSPKVKVIRLGGFGGIFAPLIIGALVAFFAVAGFTILGALVVAILTAFFIRLLIRTISTLLR